MKDQIMVGLAELDPPYDLGMVGQRKGAFL